MAWSLTVEVWSALPCNSLSLGLFMTSWILNGIFLSMVLLPTLPIKVNLSFWRQVRFHLMIWVFFGHYHWIIIWTLCLNPLFHVGIAFWLSFNFLLVVRIFFVFLWSGWVKCRVPQPAWLKLGAHLWPIFFNTHFRWFCDLCFVFFSVKKDVSNFQGPFPVPRCLLIL